MKILHALTNVNELNHIIKRYKVLFSVCFSPFFLTTGPSSILFVNVVRALRFLWMRTNFRIVTTVGGKKNILQFIVIRQKTRNGFERVCTRRPPLVWQCSRHQICCSSSQQNHSSCLFFCCCCFPPHVLKKKKKSGLEDVKVVENLPAPCVPAPKTHTHAHTQLHTPHATWITSISFCWVR